VRRPLDALTAHSRALPPKAVLALPVMLNQSACIPYAVVLLPLVTLARNALLRGYSTRVVLPLGSSRPALLLYDSERKIMRLRSFPNFSP
jgi:hypothetical protein